MATTNHSNSFFDHHLVCKIDGTQEFLDNDCSEDRSTSPSEKYQNTERLSRVVQESLSERDSECLQRVIVAGQSYREVARDLGIHHGTVRRVIERCCVKFRIDAAIRHILKLLPQGGCTIHPVTRQSSGFRGYAVCKSGIRQSFQQRPSYQQISNYLFQHREQLDFACKSLSEPSWHIGCWQNPDSNWELSLIAILPVYCIALALARVQGEAFLYDFQSQQKLPVLYPIAIPA